VHAKRSRSKIKLKRKMNFHLATKYIEGVIVNIKRSRNSSFSKTKALITDDFSLEEGTVKRATLNVRGIRLVTATEERG
jgi:hypothetical protein